MTLHDSVIGEHCFVEDKAPRCYGEILMILCGLWTTILSIWCLHRMFAYQNEAKWGVRSFIIYLSLVLSLITILHSLMLDGSPWSLAASWLVTVQGSLFTVFFIKICIRTNVDTFSLSLDWESCIQRVFLIVMLTISTSIFTVYLVMYYVVERSEIDCHHPAFTAFSGIDVVQIWCTIIAVYFIKRKIHRQHQSVPVSVVRSSPDKRSMLIEARSSPPMHSLTAKRSQAHSEKEQMSHIQMLQKSHQLLLMASFLFLSAAISAAYESWNLFNRGKECNIFTENEVVNEICRLTARLTWIFSPSWLIMYVFWIWPMRPQKYVSESSERRRHLQQAQRVRARHRCLNMLLCCRCCKYPESQSESSSPRRYDYNVSDDDLDEKRRRLISEDGDCRLSMSNGDRLLRNAEEEAQHYSLGKTMLREESSSSASSDSMGQSDIWDQHITTEQVTSPNAISRSVTRKSLIGPQHRFLQR